MFVFVWNADHIKIQNLNHHNLKMYFKIWNYGIVKLKLPSMPPASPMPSRPVPVVEPTSMPRPRPMTSSPVWPSIAPMIRWHPVHEVISVIPGVSNRVVSSGLWVRLSILLIFVTCKTRMSESIILFVEYWNYQNLCFLKIALSGKGLVWACLFTSN